MSQWNNSYVYNNQYQGENTWNGDLNTQYANQGYYPNPNQQYDSANQQYVSFNEFINQMQGNGAPQPSANNYNNSQYQNYGQYDYQNMPSTSQNSQVDSYYAGNSSNSQNGAESYQQSQYEQQPQEQASYSNELILKSNLTPTASEFVPKSTKAKPSRSVQNVPETTNSNSSNNGATEYKKSHGSSSDTNWRERPQSSQQNGETKHNSRYQDNYRHQENSNRNRDRDRDRNRYQDSNSHNYESNNRPDRNQSKSNGKSKKQDADGLTFYNSSINKRGQDHRNGKGEGSGRNRNWAGSQRLRAERNYTEDEQYANSYLQYKEEKAERLAKQDNPSPKFRNKQTAETAHTEMTQRERLSEQLDKGTLECLVCCERVKQIDPVWSCSNCYHVLHLRCIRKWAMSSVVEGKWRCPACQNTSEEIPTEYRCMCGATRAPEYQRGGSGAHTCGKSCKRPRACPHPCTLLCHPGPCPPCQATVSNGAHTCGKACKRPRACPHPCTLLCHPGPCPPCQATVSKKCGCGAETRSVLCSSKLPQVCGRTCHKTLTCGAHACQAPCHEGPCQDCEETVTQVCYCPAAKSRSVPCTRETGSQQQWSCGSACARVLACGRHVCTLACHAPPCAPCRLLPRLVLTCPCGKNNRSVPCTRETGSQQQWSCGSACARVLACGRHVCTLACHAPPCAPCRLLPRLVLTCPCGKKKLDKDSRKSCTDPIPLCGGICAKPLPCGPAGDKHFCKLDCHEGECPVCPDKTLVQCRCGHSSREVPCAELPQMINNVLCQKKCNKKLSCGRHRCRTVCCAASSHRCAVVCARTLSCQLHRCEEFCHTGHCAPCPRVSFEELRCTCGAQVLLPPVRCGARPPACDAPCRRRRACLHPPHHSCHTGDCPPCVVLTTKRCHGQHEERKTIPCSQDEFSCGLPCGKPLPCGKHTCIKTCHKGECDTSKCTQPCNEKRPSCGHPCAAPCHSGTGAPCPSAAPCRRPVRATCACGRRSADRACADNARDYNKMMSALAATKMQEGGSVDLSDVQRPGSMLKTLDCDDECRVEARTRQMALALQIRNPDVSAKLAPRYSDTLRATAAREPAFAQQIHDKLTELVHLAKKSKQKTRAHSFPSMNWQKRQFIHELCEHFGCESVAYDAEPNRNVVATADREKSWLPAMSILEVVQREAGKRKVPGPVLRPPAASSAAAAAAGNKPSGWATLTSTNAWAARSQPKPQPQPPPQDKLDYFDYPPDN